MKGAKKGVTRKAASREIMRGDASDGHVSGLVLVVAVAAEAAVVVLALLHCCCLKIIVAHSLCSYC